MNNQLQSLSKIFTEKLFRIPDYQRGYAWGTKQLVDFWNDIMQIEDNNHYTGVLTLEVVPKSIWKNWEDDKWIIDSKSFEPFYVVDGQQRLTTSIILIQAITEVAERGKDINYTSVDEIRKKFIYDSKDPGISRSYIFGYEKDNPSYEFLKKKIFLEDSGGYRDEETIYTQNLEKAKIFFLSKLKELTFEEVEVIYKKVTQNLLFNIYSISNDIDVYVAFETMNNRGKPLSNLELLKNRLIYLSTKINAELIEKNQLRKRINEAWKAIYHYLGKNKERPLRDDFFLVNHFIDYFGNDIIETIETKTKYTASFSSFREKHEKYLLEEKFTLKNIKSNLISIEDINNYILSLQTSVKIWFNIFNPTLCTDFDDEEKLWLDKLFRLAPVEYSALLLIIYLKKPSKNVRIKFIKVIERLVFLETLSYKYETQISLTEMALEIAKEEHPKFDNYVKIIETSISKMLKTHDFYDSVASKFKYNGFYNWNNIRYFLYEYELSLKASSRTKRNKIAWEEYSTERSEYVTVEHIYPQKPKDPEWEIAFKGFGARQKRLLCNSLGNLLPLSKPKNSSLQNVPFLQKIDNNKNQVGYRYGSYSENEVSKLSSWTPEEILKRGIRLLEFMENRWGLEFGEFERKREILGLGFVK